MLDLEARAAGLRPLVKTPAVERSPAFSPDGRWLAYESNASGRFEVYVQPHPVAGGRLQVSVDGGRNPAWHPRGTELFFLTAGRATGSGRMMVAGFDGRSASPIGSPRPLFDFDLRELALQCIPVRCYDVMPDGNGFFGIQRLPAPPPTPVTHIEFVLNWVQELRAKMPAAK